MDRLELIEANGWGVNPTTILAGLAARPQGALTAAEIIEYASCRFAADDAAWVQALALLSADAPIADVRDAVQDAAAPEGSAAWDEESRKWIVLDLDDLLASMPADFITGLLELTEFWLDRGLPDYMPHKVQGRGNTLTPPDYYRQEIFDALMADHRAWRDQTATELRTRRA